MKRVLTVLLIISILLCAVSCGKKGEAVTLNTENVLDYVSYTLTFDGITVRENTNITMNGEYYVTCTATLRIAPRSDLSFDDAFIWLGLEFDKGWYAVRVGGSNSGTALLYDWDDVIRLDKDGYAERTIELFCYANSYDKLHPSAAKCNYTVCSAGGTLTEN